MPDGNSIGMIPATLVLDPETGVSAIGERIAQRVRGAGSRKEVARVFNVSPRTVESWADGNPPAFKHLVAMVDEWGEAFLEDVFSPVLNSRPPLEVRLDRMASDLKAIREGLAEEQGNHEAHLHPFADGNGASDRGCSGIAHAPGAQGVAKRKRRWAAALILPVAVLAIALQMSPDADPVMRARAGGSRIVRIVRLQRIEGGAA